jgi:hypothetical protein
MALVCGEASRAIAMLDNGEWGKLKDMECTSGLMEIVTKEISKRA